MEKSFLDYEKISNEFKDSDALEDRINILYEYWIKSYESSSKHKMDILGITIESFSYILDDCGAFDEVEDIIKVESRIVVAYGFSNPIERKRDDSRLRGWIGRTEKVFGKDWDKGHFIAHSIGGQIDQSELNTFVQRRRLNRGYGEDGKLEKFCADNPDTFCFHRPIYEDNSAKPSWLEFGYIHPDKGHLVTGLFSNQIII